MMHKSISMGQVSITVLFLVAMLVMCLFQHGCADYGSTDSTVSKMRAPVKVLAISEKGDVTIQDADGWTVSFFYDTPFARSVSNSCKAGDIIKYPSTWNEKLEQEYNKAQAEREAKMSESGVGKFQTPRNN